MNFKGISTILKDRVIFQGIQINFKDLNSFLPDFIKGLYQLSRMVTASTIIIRRMYYEIFYNKKEMRLINIKYI